MYRLVSVLLFAALPALADVPSTLAWSGRVLRADGAPERGVVSLRFALFATESGGAPVWSETQSLALTAEGAYGTQLGASTPFPEGLFERTSPLFLELTIGAGAPVSPRQPLVSVATALVARTVRGGEVDASRLKVGGRDVVEGVSTLRAFRSGTHTVTLPAGVTRVHVRAWGGGGAGGTTSSSAVGVAPGGGGGAGGFAEELLTVPAGSTLTIVVGAGGAASACGASAGGVSSVSVGGASVSAGGGGAGGHAAACCPNGTSRAGSGGSAFASVALEGEAGWSGAEGGEGGWSSLGGSVGRGGDAVLRSAACSAGDAGRGGLVWLAW